jgi:hypothetical protein
LLHVASTLFNTTSKLLLLHCCHYSVSFLFLKNSADYRPRIFCPWNRLTCPPYPYICLSHCFPFLPESPCFPVLIGAFVLLWDLLSMAATAWQGVPAAVLQRPPPFSYHVSFSTALLITILSITFSKCIVIFCLGQVWTILFWTIQVFCFWVVTCGVWL